MSDDIKVKFGADTHELESGLDKLQSKAKQAFGDLDKNMASTMAVGTALGEIIGEMLVGAVEGLAEQLKETVSATVEFREEAEMLGRKLGTTATEANDIAAALGNIYTSTDEYTGAAKGMEKILKTNEESLKKLGIATRDEHGALRPLNDLMLDGIATVNQYKEGTDRNIVATQIFGKAIEDGSRLLELNKDKIAEGTAENERYGLVVGEEAVDDLMKFKAAQDDVGDSIQGMRNAVANALIPVLTQLSTWFADVAPAAILVLKGVIGGLVSVFWGLKMSAEIVWNGIATVVEVTAATIKQFANVAKAALSMDFAGAQAAWDNGLKEIQEITGRRMANVVNAAEETKEKLDRIFGEQTAITKKDGEDGKHADVKQPKKEKEAKEKAEASQLPALKSELEKRIEAELGFFKSSTQFEADYWQQKLEMGKLSAKDTLGAEHLLYQAKKKLAHEGLAAELDDLKFQSQMALESGAERVRLAQAAADKIGATYGVQSKEYTKALQDLKVETIAFENLRIKLADQAIAKQREVSLVAVDADREAISQRRAMGQINAEEEIDQLIALEQKKYDIEHKAALDSAKLIHGDTVAQKAAYDKIEVDAQKHEVEMTKLRNKRVLEENKANLSIASGFQSSLQKSLGGLLSFTMSFSTAFKNLFKGMFDAVTNELAKMASEWIVQHTIMKLFSKESATAEISSSAAKAGAAGIASFAGAPWPIDMGAPAFGASMASAAMGFAGFSAEGGFDIPAGINPLVQTHQKEMILPAEHADTIRNLSGKGGGGNTVFNISTVDAAGVKKFLMANGGAIADSLKAQARNFKVKN